MDSLIKVLYSLGLYIFYFQLKEMEMEMENLIDGLGPISLSEGPAASSKV